MKFLAAPHGNEHDCPTMGAYPGRKQVRTRAKRAAKNDRIIAQNKEKGAKASAKK